MNNTIDRSRFFKTLLRGVFAVLCVDSLVIAGIRTSTIRLGSCGPYKGPMSATLTATLNDAEKLFLGLLGTLFIFILSVVVDRTSAKIRMKA